MTEPAADTGAPVPGEVVPARDRPRWRDDIATVLRLVAVSAVLGVVAGLVWWQVAPRAQVTVGERGALDLVDGGGKAFIAADGWFAVIAAVAGLLVAAVGCWRWRRDGIGLSLGVAVGGLVGAGIAWALGQWLGAVDIATATTGAAPGTVVDAGLRLRATGVVMAWPIVGLMVVLAVAASYGIDTPPDEQVLAPDDGATADRSEPPSPG